MSSSDEVVVGSATVASSATVATLETAGNHARRDPGKLPVVLVNSDGDDKVSGLLTASNFTPVASRPAISRSVSAPTSPTRDRKLDDRQSRVVEDGRWSPRIRDTIRSVGRVARALRQKRPQPPYASFVSRQLRKYLMSVEVEELEVASGSTYNGAVMFADASGFSHMTQVLTKQAANPNVAAEELCRIINEYFSELISIVEYFGGDVVKFSGDAICIVWNVSLKESEATSGYVSPDLRVACLRACACACRVHQALDGHLAIPHEDPTQEVRLKMHIGIGCGLLTAVHVGGVFKRWEYILAGPPMAEIAAAEPLALPGETAVSPAVWEHIKSVSTGTSIGDLVKANQRSPEEAVGCEAYMRIDQMQNIVPPRPMAPAPVTDVVGNLMRRYIPNAVLPRLDDGQDGKLAELRDVSVVFATVHNLNLGPDENGDVDKAIRRGHALMLEIQRSIYRWEGSINKLLVDDKGLLVLCAMGLPPMPHADDPVRAIHAALDLVENISGLGEGVYASVGVSTGQAFCGVIGSQTRREYTLMGSVVNLGARLMGYGGKIEAQNGTQLGSIVIDETTRHAAAPFNPPFNFEAFPQKLRLKGFDEPVQAFKPIIVAQKAENGSAKSHALTEDMGGREPEAFLIASMLARLINHHGGTLVLTGERGSGKGSLNDFILKRARELDMLTLTVEKKGKSQKKDSVLLRKALMDAKRRDPGWSAEDEVGDAPKYFAAWSSIFRSLVSRASEILGIPASKWVASALEGDEATEEPDLRQHAHLLLPILPKLRVPARGVRPNDDTSTTTVNTIVVSPAPDDLAARELALAEDLLFRLVVRFADISGVLIALHLQTGTAVLADVGSESWALARRVSQSAGRRQDKDHPLILCIITRALAGDMGSKVQDIVEAAKAVDCCLELRPLDETNCVRYSAQVLSNLSLIHVRDAALPPELVQLLKDRAAGNPKHIKEILKALLGKDARGPNKGPAIKVLSNGRVKLLISSVYDVPVPAKTKNTLQQQFEQLPSAQCLLLKIASSFKAFSPGMLADVYGVENEDKLINERMRNAQRRDYARHLKNLEQIGVLSTVPAASPYVYRYFPKDVNEIAYCFTSKLQQEIVQGLMTKQWRDRLNHVIASRFSSVVSATIKMQSTVRAWQQRRKFLKMFRDRTRAAILIQAAVRSFLKLRRTSTEPDLHSVAITKGDTLRRLNARRGSVQSNTSGASNSSATVESPIHFVTGSVTGQLQQPGVFSPARSFLSLSPGRDGTLTSVVVNRNIGRKLPPLPPPHV